MRMTELNKAEGYPDSCPKCEGEIQLAVLDRETCVGFVPAVATCKACCMCFLIGRENEEDRSRIESIKEAHTPEVIGTALARIAIEEGHVTAGELIEGARRARQQYGNSRIRALNAHGN